MLEAFQSKVQSEWLEKREKGRSNSVLPVVGPSLGGRGRRSS